MNRMSVLSLRAMATPAALLVSAAVLVLAAVGRADQIVDHPDQLKYDELKYQPPKPEAFRHTLKCGATAYIAEHPEVPTVELTVLVRTGSMYEPVEKAGLVDMTGYLMRNGGVEGMTAKELDLRLAYLAGEISVRGDGAQGAVTLFCLSKDMAEGLELLKKVLRTPVFAQEALDRYRKDVLSELEQRNASTSAIEGTLSGITSLSGLGGTSCHAGRATTWMACAVSHASMNVRSRSLRNVNHFSRSSA